MQPASGLLNITQSSLTSQNTFMRSIYTLCISMLFILSCKKEAESEDALSKPVIFSSTAYENACSWDAFGKPDCLLARDNISPELIEFTNNTLQEGKDLRYTNPGLLSSTATADLQITQSSDVFITFLTQGTSQKNSFGYYTFPTSQPPKSAADIKKITYVFPSVGYGTPLQPGDKVKIGRFDPGTSIGFVLLKDAWDPVTKIPNNGAVHFCSNDVLNPEINPKFKKHAVLINYAPENKLLIGWDDADRTTSSCDHDFNDVVLYATIKP